jgi:hypothetical protein
MKTSELSGAALDWAVAKCEGKDVWIKDDGSIWEERGEVSYYFRPSNRWNHGGPIIEREKIAVWSDVEGGWFASGNEGTNKDYHAENPLIAAMRCYVDTRLGDEIDLPEELL